MQHIELTHEAIDLNNVLRSVSDPDAGGVVLFLGTTRRTTLIPSKENSQQLLEQTQQTEFLVYEAHESMAFKQLRLLAEECHQRWPVRATAIVHRLGKVMPEEASIAIAVSSPHRAEAYEASRWLIDSIKRDVPIWKQEHFQDNSAAWVHPEPAKASKQCGQGT